ncbi:MAG: C25 family cysteine peptidase [Caldisericia bacterium]|nr:C25 family cysteine peptidase [Caldisericia bacterium]
MEATKVSLPQDTILCAPPVKRLFDFTDFLKDTAIEEDSVVAKSLQEISAEEGIRKGVSVFDYQNVYPTMNVKHTIENSSQGRFLVLHINPVYIYQGSVYCITKIRFDIGLQSTDEEARPDEKTNSSVIVTPDELLQEAKDLAQMHKDDGFDTTIVCISEVQAYPVAENPSISLGFADAPEEYRKSVETYDLQLAGRIRSMLREKLEKDEVDYVTILGDATYVPPSYYEFSPDMLDDIDQWIPTDIYYASPFYKEELTFEISVGRLPVQNKAEAQSQIDKIKRYREGVQQPETWKNSVALFSGDPFRGDYFGELAQCRVINEDIFNGFSIQKNFQTSQLFTKDVFLQTLENEPQTFLWTMGHGSGTAFMLEKDAVKGTDLETLSPQKQLPIIVSEACGNGAWDTRFTTPTEKDYSKSFSEAVLTSLGAGIAYVGGARVNYASYNITDEKCIQKVTYVGFMDGIVENFFRSTHQYPDHHLGDWALKALEQYYVNDYSSSRWLHPAHIKTLFGFTLLGDPTLSIPLPEKSASYTVPDIDITEGLYDSIYGTILSIDQKAVCKIQTDSPTLQYLYATLEQDENEILLTGELSQTQNQTIETTLDYLQKKVATIRFSTNDYKEKRAVFDGRYEYDLSLQKSYDFTLLREHEQRAHYIEVVNEGIHPILNAKMDLSTTAGDSLHKVFPIINRDSTESIYFQYTFPSIGEYTIQTNIRDVVGETYTNDNERTTVCRVVDEPICRVGILSSKAYYPIFAEALFSIEELNQQFAQEGQLIELQVVEYGKDAKGRVSYDLLGFDALVLFDTFWVTGTFSQMLQDLEQFAQNGGKILGIHSAIPGNEQVNMKYTSLQTFFGIRPDVLVSQDLAEETITDFEIPDSLLHSETNSYKIENQYVLVPKDEELRVQNWSSSHLLDSCKIIGTSSQKGLSLIQRDTHIFFFTGLLYNRYFTDTSDTFRLFHDLIQSLFDPVQNGRITLVEKKDTDSLLAAYETTMWNVEVSNQGSLPTSEIWLQVEQNEKISLGVFQGHERKTHEVSLYSPQMGTCSFAISLWSGDQQETQLDQYSLRYVAQKPNPSKEDLQITLDHWKPGKTLFGFENHCEISGTAYPGSIFRIGDQSYPVDGNGEFQLWIHSIDAPEYLRCHLEFDDVQGEPLEIPIQWFEQNEVYFHIGDHHIMSQGESKTIDSPPIILAGRTLVPISTIADCFDAAIQWDSKTQTIDISYMDRSISLQIGSKSVVRTIDGVEEVISMDTPPLIIKGRTMVPLRCIADCFSADIQWEGSTQVITLKAYRLQPSLSKSDVVVMQSTPSATTQEIFTSKANLPSYVLSCQENEEGLFVATKFGIHHYNNGEEVSFMSYPEEFNSQFLSYDPEKFFFAVHEDYFIIPNHQGVYRMHRDTHECSLFLSQEETDLLVVAKDHYYRIEEMLIHDDLLYILCARNGIMVYNVHTQEYLYTLGILYGTSMAFSDPYLVITTLFGDLMVYNVSEKTLHTCELHNLYENGKVAFENDTTLALYDLYDEEEWISLSFEEVVSQDSIDMEEWEAISSFSRFRGALCYIASGPSHYGIAMDSTGGVLDFTTEIVQVDFKKAKIDSVIEDDITDCKRIRNWIPNPTNVRIIADCNRLVCAQDSPGNQDTVFYTQEDKITRHTLKTSKNPMFSQSFGYAWKDNSYSALNLDIDFEGEEMILYLLLDVTDFSEDKPKHKGPYKVNVGTGDFSVSSYAFSDDYLVIHDAFKNSLLWFDISSHDLENRQYCIPQDKRDVPLSISNLTMVDDVVYFLDPVGKAMYSSTLEEGFTKIVDLSAHTRFLKVDNLVVDGEFYYIYDVLSNSIIKCNDREVLSWIPATSVGASTVQSLDISASHILYHDSLAGIVAMSTFDDATETIHSDDDIYFSSNALLYDFYPGMKSTEHIGVYVKKPFKNLQIETNNKEIQIGEIQQKQSQILALTITPTQEKNLEIKVIVDGFEKVFPIHMKQKEMFVTLFDQSIFTHTWKGCCWSKVPCVIQEKQQFCWIDIALMEQLFPCEIYAKEDVYFLSFEGITLEAQPNESWYIYQNKEGQRYRRDGVLFQKNDDNVTIEPTLYTTYRKGRIKRSTHSVTISGL